MTHIFCFFSLCHWVFNKSLNLFCTLQLPTINHINYNPQAIWIKITFSTRFGFQFQLFFCRSPMSQGMVIEIHIIRFRIFGLHTLDFLFPCRRAHMLKRCDVMCWDESNELCINWSDMKWIRFVSKHFYASKLFVQTPVQMTGSHHRLWRTNVKYLHKN